MSCSHTLQLISQEKDFGVMFNTRLSFDTHINDKVSKEIKYWDSLKELNNSG